MKKIVAGVLVVAAAFVLVACSRGQNVNNDEETSPASSDVVAPSESGSRDASVTPAEGPSAPAESDDAEKPGVRDSIPPRDFTIAPNPNTPRIPEQPAPTYETK